MRLYLIYGFIAVVGKPTTLASCHGELKVAVLKPILGPGRVHEP